MADHAEDLRRLSESMRSYEVVGRYAGLPDQYSQSMRTMEGIERSIAEAKEAPTARRAVQRIMDEIREFEASLDEVTEVGIRLISFGSSLLVHVSEIGFHQPNLIVVIGETEDRAPVKLIQHLSQLSFLLVRAPRLRIEEPPRRVGFRVTSDYEAEG